MLKTVKKYISILKPIAIVLIIALTIYSCQSSDVGKISAFSHPPGSPQVVTDTLQLFYSDSATIRFKLECPKLLIYSNEDNPYNEFPKGFKIIQYDKDKKVLSHITASYGKYYEKKDLWEAKQNVVAVTEQGDTLKTELLYWDQKKEKIYTDQYVKIIRKEQIITGIGFESDIQIRNYKIVDPKGTFSIETNQ